MRGACVLCGGGGGGGLLRGAALAAARRGSSTGIPSSSSPPSTGSVGHQGVVEALIGSKAAIKSGIEAENNVSLSRDAGDAAQGSTPPGSECRLGQVCRGWRGGGGGGADTRCWHICVLKRIYTVCQGCGSATRFRDCRTKMKIIKNLLSPGHVAARRSSRYKTLPKNLCFVDYTKCRSTLPIRIWILAFCQCTAIVFLPNSVESNFTLTLVVSLRSCLPGIAKY